MKNFKNPEKLKEFYTEYVIPITYILRLTFYYTCIYLSLNYLSVCQSILIFGCISKSVTDISTALCKYITMAA